MFVEGRLFCFDPVSLEIGKRCCPFHQYVYLKITILTDVFLQELVVVSFFSCCDRSFS